MTLSAYFATAADTGIAATDPVFIDALAARAADAQPGNPTIRRTTNPDSADLIVVDERYDYRTWRYAETLSSCAFVRQYSKRILVINHDCYARVFLPGIYTSLERHNLPRTCARSGPYKRDLWQVSMPDRTSVRPGRLFSFRGTFHTHPVRRELFEILDRHPDGEIIELRKAFHAHTDEDQKTYIRHILDAEFVICPRGLSPSTYRLFETMQLGRCPVIISDAWIPPAGPDWEQFSLRIPESRIASIPDQLHEHRQRAAKMGELAAHAWDTFFSWPARLDYLLAELASLHEIVKRVPEREFGEMYAYWNSLEFKRLYQWTLLGRIRQRIDKALSPDPSA